MVKQLNYYLHHATTNYANYQVALDNHTLKILTWSINEAMLRSIPLKTH